MGRSSLVTCLGLLALALGSVAHANTTPNDPGFPQQWALANNGQSVNGTTGTPDADIDAEEAWDLTTGVEEIVVAVVDSGIDYEHFDLTDNVWLNGGEIGSDRESNGIDDDGNGYVDDWRGWDAIDGDGSARDRRGHGTRVTGIVAATGNDGFGIAGVTWSNRVMSVRVGTTSPTVEYSDLVEGLRYAVANDARVVNVSIGKSEYSAELERVIADSPETLFVAASGNGGADEVGDDVDTMSFYPCSLQQPNVICVASTDSRDELDPSSNYGLRSVDLAAPGESVITTSAGHVFYDDLDGTSTTWTRGGTNSAWTRAITGRNGYLVSETGDYQPGSDTYVRTKDPFSFEDEEECRLQYLALLDGDSGGDQLIVETSTDGASWVPVRTITQTSNGSRFFDDDVSFLDDQPTVYVRFRLVTDAQGVGSGAVVDQIWADCERGPQDIYDFSYSSGTSFAAPHVSGAAALLFALRPDASPLEVKEALLEGVDRVSSLEGKVATAGRLNLRTAMDLLRGNDEPPEITDVSDRPDPFSPNGDGRRDRLKIRFTVSEPVEVVVRIRNRRGRIVWRFRRQVDEGRHVVRWNGRRMNRRRLPSGRYRYFITATDPAGNTATAKGVARLRR